VIIIKVVDITMEIVEIKYEKEIEVVQKIEEIIEELIDMIEDVEAEEIIK